MATIGPFETLPGLADWLNRQDEPEDIVTAALIEYRHNHRLPEEETDDE